MLRLPLAAFETSEAQFLLVSSQGSKGYRCADDDGDDQDDDDDENEDDGCDN